MLILNAVGQINDAERSGRPNLDVVLKNIKNVHKIILAHRKENLHEVAEKLEISKDGAITILLEHLSISKLCSK